MTWETWLLFVLTEALLSLTPGPAVLFVVSQGIRGGVPRSIGGAAGVLTANAFYFALSATGLGAILLASYDVFFAIKWMGAAYLVYLGLHLIFRREDSAAMAEAPGSADSVRRTVMNGFALQAANPKALIFFTALLPQFVDTSTPAAPQIAILGVSSVIVEFIILLGYGTLASRASGFARQPRFVSITNRLCGSLLIAAGARLATIRRP